MPPYNDPLISTLGMRPHHVIDKNGDEWLDSRRQLDETDGYWRIHNALYDLTNFIKHHPGGAEWIELSKGTDITEAFEVHHLTDKPIELLKKYYVKDALNPRNSPFTFADDGFYRTLKRQVKTYIQDVPKEAIVTTANLIDGLLFLFFLFAIIANAYRNYLIGALSGSCLAILTIAAHNYLHQKDNLRMYYIGLSMMSRREWRISHVLSHHLYTNTVEDLEILSFEPLLKYFPKEKPFYYKILCWLIFPLVCLTNFHKQYIGRWYGYLKGTSNNPITFEEIIPWTVPLTLYLLTNQTIINTLWMWTFIIFWASLHFYFVGFNAAHHHPDIFHDGDKPREIKQYDWGIAQLDALMDRTDISGSHFLVLTNFGDHALHHFFPTLDHGILSSLYPIFHRISQQFGVQLRWNTQWNMIVGQHLHLIRGTNPNPPDLFKKYH